MTQRAPAANSQPAQSSTSALKSFFVRGLTISVGVTVAIVLFLISLGDIQLSQFGVGLLKSFLFCICIGLPSTVTLNWVSLRFSDWAGRWMHLINVALLILISLFGLLCGDWIFILLGFDKLANLSASFFSYAPFCIFSSLAVGLSLSVYERMRRRLQTATLELRTRQLEQERANKLLAEARLSSLESRVHPHFLFNTLNSIAALIHSDPQCAEKTVEQLASLLRFSLTANQHGTVALRQEEKIVRDYLEIERTRFRERLRFSIDIPGSLDAKQIPPLALQTLVENAIKHVVAQRQEGASITIRGALQEDVLYGESVYLEVCDDGPGFSLDSIQPEHGLGNLVSRLKLLYGSAGELRVERQDGRTVVALLFPAKPNHSEVS
ncbi:sensor histidine kinase [Telmatobacter bradus]|uniref:sensor histidine kinase n=1 Tax=Telmatobacter bradus TaxID=474953 RepID=UPI003B42F954